MARFALLFLFVPCFADGALAKRVLEVSYAFADGGGYLWKGGTTGVPCEIRHGGEVILEKQPEGTYCSGFTFAVVMRVAEDAGLLRGKSVEDVRRFQREWYGSVEDEETRERQCSVALARLGLGEAIAPKKARPGDFLQLWRTNGSGHSVVFLGWETEKESIVGIRYRSSQSSTDGIGDRVERFEGAGGSVDSERIYFGRLGRSGR